MTLGRPGDLLANRYRLDRPVGSHDAVEHWLGYDERLARSVTVRLVPVADEAAQEESAQAALSTMARLNHSGVAAVYDVGTIEAPGVGPVSYAVSEWIDGRTLGQIMATGPQPWPRVSDWGRQIAAALAALHGIGVVHGSLEPNSVAIHDDRQVKILDAGLDSPPVEETPPFDAPEDVYALGMLLWYATVGAVPFFGPEGLDQGPLLQAGAPPELAALFTELLAADPAFRPTAAAAERRFGPFAVTERIADTLPGIAAVAPTQMIEPTQVIRPTARPATRAAGAAAEKEKRRRRGLLLGLALLLAAIGTAVGLVVANLGASGAASPNTLPTVTGTSSPGVVTLQPGASRSTSRAARSAPATSAAPSTAASTAASPSASPSASPTPSQTPSPSAPTSAQSNPTGQADGPPTSPSPSNP